MIDTGNNMQCEPRRGKEVSEWRERLVQGLLEAEQILERVEKQGFQDRELSVLPDDKYIVRWRCVASTPADAIT